MIVWCNSHSKSTRILKVVEFKVFKNSKYVSKFQKSITISKWGVMYKTHKTSYKIFHSKTPLYEKIN
jgi:hypothetical protein